MKTAKKVPCSMCHARPGTAHAPTCLHGKPRPKKRKVKPNHISTNGHGSSTYCGIRIPEFGSGEPGPDFGGRTAHSEHTCLDCVVRFVALKTIDLNDAVDVLFKLVEERGLLVQR